MRSFQFVLFILFLGLSGCGYWSASHPPPFARSQPITQDETALISYASVEPIFAQHCTNCHGEKVAKKKVRLDSFDEVIKNLQGIDEEVFMYGKMPPTNKWGEKVK